MEEYNLIKNKVNDKLIFKLSQIGYALYCNAMFTNRVKHIPQDINIVSKLKNGDKIFISNAETNICFNALTNILNLKQIKVYFYLMGEPIIPRHIIDRLLPYSLAIFANNNVYDHPNIHIMPIGIRDCEYVVPNHKGFNHNYLVNEGNIVCNKEFLCLLCFSFSHEDRNVCYNALSNKSFITNLNKNDYEKQPSIHCGKVPVWINYNYTHKSDYTISPRGCGEDCHRFYEAIYLDSIPIVKRTNTAFDKLFNIFPCLVIDNWEDVTEELLLQNKEFYFNKIQEFKKKYPNAFTDLDSIHELLLQT